MLPPGGFDFPDPEKRRVVIEAFYVNCTADIPD